MSNCDQTNQGILSASATPNHLHSCLLYSTVTTNVFNNYWSFTWREPTTSCYPNPLCTQSTLCSSIDTLHRYLQSIPAARNSNSWLEAKFDINHSPNDITSTLSDREPCLGLSSRGNQNKKRTIEIAEINLIHHQEAAAEDDIDSADDNNENT